MTATNMCSNFGGFRCSPPLVNPIFVPVSSCLFCCLCIIVVGWLESVQFHSLYFGIYSTSYAYYEMSMNDFFKFYTASQENPEALCKLQHEHSLN